MEVVYCQDKYSHKYYYITSYWDDMQFLYCRTSSTIDLMQAVFQYFRIFYKLGWNGNEWDNLIQEKAQWSITEEKMPKSLTISIKL